MTAPPQLPSWATPKADGGPPAPDSPLDRQFAAFVGPRWPVYRRKFAPFFVDARFQPTWNWAAALLCPFWFLYRKLYLPFVLFYLLVNVGFGIMWSGREPLQQMPMPSPTGTLDPVMQDASLMLFGIMLSAAVLAGGTANFLLFRRATAAIRVVAPRAPDVDAGRALLQRLGGVSWRAVLVGFSALILLQAIARGTATS